MAEVKAEFPIGKTQWKKWNADQRKAFNETRAAGVPFDDAVDYANRLELVEVNIAPKSEPKKKNLFDVIEDVADAVTDVAEVAAQVPPVISIAKTVIKSAPKKKGK